MNKNQIKEFFTQISEKRNNFALVAAVISLIAMFMPYATVSLWGFSESINYISTDDGKIYLILLIASAWLYFLKRNGLGCAVAVLMTVVSLYDLYNFSKVAEESFGLAKQGAGSYLVILGAVLMVAAPFIGAKIEALVSSSLNSKTNN